eukprot:540209-Prymnesium_polylepis.1
MTSWPPALGVFSVPVLPVAIFPPHKSASPTPWNPPPGNPPPEGPPPMPGPRPPPWEKVPSETTSAPCPHPSTRTSRSSPGVYTSPSKSCVPARNTCTAEPNDGGMFMISMTLA